MLKVGNRRLQHKREERGHAKRLYEDAAAENIQVRFLAEYGDGAVYGEEGHYGGREDVEVTYQ